jgi:hypothetical protein
VRTRVLHSGDVVMVSRLGRVFYAKVTGLERAGLVAIEPLDRRVTYRSAKAREIIDHWSHARANQGEQLPDGQLPLEGWGA